MTSKTTKIVKTVVLAAGLSTLIIIAGTSDWLITGAAVSCVALVSGRWGRLWWGRRAGSKPAKAGANEDRPQAGARQPVAARPAVAEPRDLHEYVELLLAQGRHALLLRPQIAENLQPAQLTRAIQAMHEDMAPVPPGQVLLAQPDLSGNENGPRDGHGHVLTVHAYALDRYPVTNRQFKVFVDAGGYEDPAFWEPAVWPGVNDFLDSSGQTSPRFWQDRCYPESLADHPVVGVSWYEAQAYARWAGKRLPSDPEWVKAGSWPVAVAGGAPQQRRYPWGNTLDTDKANLWASGTGSTVPVFAYAEGVSVGGVYQLIGNVWEWTTADYGAWHADERIADRQNGLKSLRGGAFDTYFESHAVCQFQSGDSPLARKHNIGFRCALGACDVTPEALKKQS